MSVLTNWVLKRRAALVLIMIVVLIFGSVAVTQLKNELLPNIEFPYLTVATVYPGASAGDVEQQVSKPVEQVVGGVSGLKSLRTVSNESFSFIVAEFEYGTVMKDVQQTIDTNLRNVTLPNDLRGQRLQPTVSTLNVNSQPVLYLGVEGLKGQTSEQLTQQVRQQILPTLSGLDGVSQVQVVGDQIKEVKIVPKPQVLQQRGLSVNDISTALKGYNSSFPAGSFDVSGQSVSVRTAYTFGSVDDLKNLPVVASAAAPSGQGQAPSGATAGGTGTPPSGQAQPTQPAAGQPTITHLSDVADVQEQPAPSGGVSRTNGKPGILLQVYKTQNGNTVKVSDSALAQVKTLSDQSGGAFQVRTVYDSAQQVRSSIDGLVREGLLGAVFAVLVIFLFLRNLRSTLVTAISIPTSLVVAFILLWTQNISLNIMTLGGLAVAVGRVVDDAIVVLENIFRRVQAGEPIETAAKLGTKEVSSAITSSTLTTVAVFLPLGFVGGITGQFFLPFALTVTFALLASLIVALTVIPVFATFFIRRKMKAGQPVMEEEKETWIQRFYTPILKWSLRNRWKVLGLAAVLFFASTLLVTKVPIAFLSSSGDKLLQVAVHVAPGTSQDAIAQSTQKIDDALGNDNRVTLRQTTIAGNSSLARSQRAFGQGSDASILIVLDKNADLKQTAQDLRNKLKPITPNGGSVTVSELSGFSSSNFSVNIQANDGDSVRKASDLVLARLKPIADRGDFANLRSDVSALSNQVLVTPKPDAAGGRINTQTLGFLLAGTLQPQTTTSVRFGSNADAENVVIYPTSDPAQGSDINAFVTNLKALPIAGGLTLGAVADVKVVQAPTQASRIGQKPAAAISADLTSDNTGGVTRDAQTALKGIEGDQNWPAGASWTISGVSAQQSQAFGGLFIALGIAIALVYIVMVIAFGSLLEPFAILFALPLATIGAFAALFITQRPIGLPAMIGLLMLIGIVVTNAIVLLDRVNHNREHGMERNEALIEAGRNRIRPILMTALATILALMPLALGLSEGSIIAAELGTVVIGGLLTSTLLTLIVVPVVYSLLTGATERLSRRGKKGDGKGDNQPGEPLSLSQPVITPAADSGTNDGVTDVPATQPSQA